MRVIPKMAIIGAGGFCRDHHRTARLLEEAGELKLVATCDPNSAVLAAADEKFGLAERGVRLFGDYVAMLDFCAGQGCAFVAVPTPVPLHAAMHEAVVSRGMAVYLEKPPTLDLDELERMVVVDKRAKKATEVGFNFIVQPARHALKARLLGGEFGPLEEVTLVGHWPRGVSYFKRASWAGQLMMNGRLVLDSIMSNAMAHNVHDLLFWAGAEGVLSWARPVEVRSVMVHGHDIPSADTNFVAAELETGVRLRMGLSHAATGQAYERETARCRDAMVVFKPYSGGAYEVLWKDGRVEKFVEDADCLKLNFRAYLAYLAGEKEEGGRPMTRLEDCRGFVELCGMAFLAGAVGRRIVGVEVNATGEERAIAGIKEMMEAFVETGIFPERIGGVAVAAGVTREREGLGRRLRADLEIERLRD